MKNTLAIFSLKSISKFVIQFLVLIFLISLSACYRKEILNFPGIILTLPNDDPITDTIIWSSAEPNIILASGADYPSHITNIHTIDISTLEKQVVLDEEPGDLNIT